MTIEQLLKLKLEDDIKRITNDKMNVVVTNDLSLHFTQNKPKENDLLVVISSGNGTRTTTQNGYFITQTLAITAYVNKNKLQEFLTVLTKYSNTESMEENIQTLTGDDETTYSFYINYNTPTTDGLLFRLGIYEFTTVMLMGTLMYTENADLELGPDTIYSFSVDGINFMPLNNLQALSGGPKLSVTGEIIQGNLNTIPVVGSLGHDYSFRFLYDKNDPLHVMLFNLTKGATKEQLTMFMGIDNGESFKVFITPTVSQSQMGFRFIDLTVSKVVD